ncbi:DUF4293 domain-containing protein [Bacteroides sedimenti]|uniref:Membrane protein n=1 Tax=Bacteroides sedimenti TaxID=2136147 RepID=A0ABN6Z845_9BACE
MIQRIQTVYLLLVAALLTITIFIPVGSFIDTNGLTYPFTPLNITLPSAGLNYTPWGQLAILILAAMIAFATIFLFKNRKLQMRMCVFNSLIIAGYYLVYLMFILMTKGSSNVSFQFSFGLCLPVISLILTYLAFRSIRKDDAMVKAADRIR